jgi:hypothetical protein
MSKPRGGGGSGLHNKPIGCSASGPYAPGPEEGEEGEGVRVILHWHGSEERTRFLYKKF